MRNYTQCDDLMIDSIVITVFYLEDRLISWKDTCPLIEMCVLAGGSVDLSEGGSDSSRGRACGHERDHEDSPEAH